MVDDMDEKEKLSFVFGVQDESPLVSPWNREVATTIARQMDLELSDVQWDVVTFLRQHFETAGTLDYARDLSVLLEQKFKPLGGLKYLYRLFPKGPVTQGCTIAGIPVPKSSTDPSFGTTA